MTLFDSEFARVDWMVSEKNYENVFK